VISFSRKRWSVGRSLSFGFTVFLWKRMHDGWMD
jgi:hypothetical protein